MKKDSPRGLAAGRLRAEYPAEHEIMLQDRAIYDDAVNVKNQAFQMELDAVDRLRHHSREMQRNIEELVEMRDQARVEAMHFRLAEAQAANAAREAHARPDAVVRQLRQQLVLTQTELAAAVTPQSVRDHTEEVVAARQEEAELARASSLLKATSSIPATEKGDV